MIEQTATEQRLTGVINDHVCYLRVILDHFEASEPGPGKYRRQMRDLRDHVSSAIADLEGAL